MLMIKLHSHRKREISSSYVTAEAYRTRSCSLISQSAGCVMYLYWSSELGLLSYLKQTAVKQRNKRCFDLSSYKEDMVWSWYYVLYWNNLREHQSLSTNKHFKTLDTCVQLSRTCSEPAFLKQNTFYNLENATLKSIQKKHSCLVKSCCALGNEE